MIKTKRYLIRFGASSSDTSATAVLDLKYIKHMFIMDKSINMFIVTPLGAARRSKRQVKHIRRAAQKYLGS